MKIISMLKAQKLQGSVQGLLVCRGYHDEVPQPGQLRQHTFTFSQFRRLQVPDQGVRRVGLSGGLSPRPADGPLLWIYRLSSLCASVLISSFKDISHIGWGPTLITSY